MAHIDQRELSVLQRCPQFKRELTVYQSVDDQHFIVSAGGFVGLPVTTGL